MNIVYNEQFKILLETYDFILLLPDDNKLIRSIFETKLSGRKGMILEGDEAQQLLSLYSLYEFSDKIIVGSFNEPYGQKLYNLIDCGIATEEELINDVILGVM
jgi:hypothetical protein